MGESSNPNSEAGQQPADRSSPELLLEAALTGIEDHVAIFDAEWRYVFVNRGAARALGRSEAELLGHVIWELFPDAVGNQFYREVHQAVAERRAIHSEHFYQPFDTWFENHIYPIEGGVCVVSTDITERKRAEIGRERMLAQLEAERQRNEAALREAGRRKDEFLAMLAHELRSPLAPIGNAAQALRVLGGSDPQRDRAQQIIERQVAHLARLVDDLLDISRITQGKVALKREVTDLATVVTRAVEAAQPLVESRRHRLTVSLPETPIFVDADLVRLSQVLGNLLGNASKYTPEGGSIELLTALVDGQAVLTVRDDGIGIQAELLPRVFDLFTQADHSLARTDGGLGIGLTLVRSLVELHGGTVEPRSEGPGRGSEFVVRLPALSATGAGPRTPPSVPAPAAPARRILVVDDNRDSAESMELLLSMNGHEVRVALDGYAALMAADAFQPEVVLLDLGLPGLDGYEVARRLRSERHARPLLIAVTGYGREEDLERSREAGFDHHLLKPVEFAVLQKLLSGAPATARPGELAPARARVPPEPGS